MRIYITGAGGFVGGHLIRHLEGEGDEVFATSRDKRSGIHEVVDIAEADAVKRSIQTAVPEAVVHLAAQPSVPRSWEDPETTYRVNVLGTLNILLALKGSSCKLLLVGSAQQYASGSDGSLITEDLPMVPNSPYAASKIAAEQLAVVYQRAAEVSAICTRSFNHTGPGQTSHYAVGSFASQIVDIEQGRREPRMNVGDLSPRRDLLDVRDVVAAYRFLLDKGKPGEAYNVCSGVAVRIGEVLEVMLKSTGLLGQVEVIEDDAKRKGDPSVIVGDPSKLKAATGWEPKIRLETSLVDTLDWYREAIGREER